MTLSLEQILFIGAWLSVAVGVIVVSSRADTLVGWAVSLALIGYVIGGLAIGVYLRDVRGRDYLAPDEQAFQVEAVHIVNGWRTGQPYAPTITDGWPYVNAMAVRVWGPSLTPMRLLNALVGATTVAAAYWLARVVFEDTLTARLTAVLVALSPSLFVWSLTNMKERTLGLMIVLAIAGAVLLVKGWTWMRLAGLLVAVYVLGEVRHYYAPLVGWLAIAGFAVCGSMAWPKRLVQLAVLTLALGFVLQAVTGTFMGINTPHETVTRYVPLPGATYSALGETAGRSETVTGLDPIRLARHVLFVLAGGFDARRGAGKFLALITWPEWLVNFVLLPLALWSSFNAIRQRRVLAFVPMALVAGLVLLLAYTYGDDWTTFRFRAVYWPVYLMLAAAGAAQLHRSRASHRPFLFSSAARRPV